MNNECITCKVLTECPITGLQFFMVVKNESGEMVPTYGGPNDSYTLPIRIVDGDKIRFYRKRYDHAAGSWAEGVEELPFIAVAKEHLDRLEEDHKLLLS